MWFRQRNPSSTDREIFRMGSFRNRNRSKKTADESAGGKEPIAVASAPPTPLPNARTQRDDAISSSSSNSLPRSRSGRRPSVLSEEDDGGGGGGKEKNKALRADSKYKKNRVTKSQSRTRVAPDLKVEKPNSSKSNHHHHLAHHNSSGTNNSTSSTVNGQRKSSGDQTATATATLPQPKVVKRNTTLNFNALLRYKSFISGSTKKLTSADFERIRRKSLGDNGKVRRKSNPDSENTNANSKTNPNETNVKTNLHPTQQSVANSEKSNAVDGNDNVFDNINDNDGNNNNPHDEVDASSKHHHPQQRWTVDILSTNLENGIAVAVEDVNGTPPLPPRSKTAVVKKGRSKIKKKGF